ncbi:MAG: hypothetical protein Q8K36_05525, partial [Alphaproteobacteria bacterium]|nr:hypothetical protein [Alphaproteobacteria bacterium]
MPHRPDFGKRLNRPQYFTSARSAVDHVHELYCQESKKLLDGFDAIASKQKLKDFQKAHYPAIGFEIQSEHLKIDGKQSYGFAQDPGLYYTTLTRPDIFDSYYVEQIEKIIENHQVEIVVGESDWS